MDGHGAQIGTAPKKLPWRLMRYLTPQDMKDGGGEALEG
jgi:hypothetical protein